MAKSYTIYTTVAELTEAMIPVRHLGFDSGVEAVVLAAELHYTNSGEPFWSLLEFDQQWSLPFTWAAVIQEHDE